MPLDDIKTVSVFLYEGLGGDELVLCPTDMRPEYLGTPAFGVDTDLFLSSFDLTKSLVLVINGEGGGPAKQRGKPAEDPRGFAPSSPLPLC